MVGPAEIDEFYREIERLSAKAFSLGIHSSHEEIARRIMLCESAGIVAPDEIEQRVLSGGVSAYQNHARI